MSNRSVLSLITLLCSYLCVEGALILRSTRPKRTHGQREEGPSPEQPEAAVPRDGGHGLGARGVRQRPMRFNLDSAIRCHWVFRRSFPILLRKKPRYKKKNRSELFPCRKATTVFNSALASWKRAPFQIYSQSRMIHRLSINVGEYSPLICEPESIQLSYIICFAPLTDAPHLSERTSFSFIHFAPKSLPN